MNNTIHRLFLFSLFFLGILTVLSIPLRNLDYYILPNEERPFHDRYNNLKPSGIESHGYGIVGSAMIIVGVIMYSSRKRIRAFNQIGRIKHFLEFHIFLCLVGPILVLYHTTFKFGGIVAVSFWSMTAVVLSGIVGRYLYVQIPKGIQGNELDIKELEETNAHLRHRLEEEFGFTESDLKKIDAIASPKRLQSGSIVSLLIFFIIGDVTHRSQLKKLVRNLQGYSIDAATISNMTRIAGERIILLRRIQFLEQVKHYFHYWHVIHLPFSIIMFTILLIHVGVSIAFGYTWIF